MQEYDWQEALDHAVTPGDIIAGRYRVDGAIGAGGMGVVLKAWHLVFDARVAIKVLLPERVANAEARARFDREARATFQIRSEHVPRVHDIGTLEAGLPYIVMEYLRGRTLSRLVKDKGRFQIPTAVDYILQACDAVAEAHALGIVHRDLKPANLLVTHRANGSACIKVLDFGLAKAGYHQGSLTTVHRSMGTPRYMSPEQWLSARDAGPPTDIWALGATLFEMLTGSAPFTADQIDALCQMVLQSSPPALTSLRPNAPARLEAVVATCLQRNPRHRFRSVASLAKALAEFAPALSRTLPAADGRAVAASSHVVDSQQAANGQWDYEVEARRAAAADRTVHDPREPVRAIQVEEVTTAQIAHRHEEAPAEVDPAAAAWAAGAESAQAEDFAVAPYGPNGAERGGATMVDGAPPAGLPEDPVIEWSEDDAAQADKATKVLQVDQEARTQRMRREDARKLLELPPKRTRRKTQTVRKVIGLVLLAVAGFLGGAALTKVVRDMHHSGSTPGSDPGAAGDSGLDQPDAGISVPPPADRKIQDGAVLGTPDGEVWNLDDDDADAGLQVDAAASEATSAEPEPKKPAPRKRSKRRRRAHPRVARSTRAAGNVLSDSWELLRGQL